MNGRKHSRSRQDRIWEIDAWRGFSVLLMLFYHFVYDLRYVFGYNVAAYQENPWFYLGLRGLIVLGFLTAVSVVRFRVTIDVAQDACSR